MPVVIGRSLLFLGLNTRYAVLPLLRFSYFRALVFATFSRRSLNHCFCFDPCRSSLSRVSFQGASKAASEPASKMAGDHGNVHIISDEAAWDAKLEEAKNAGKIVVVDFTATWCGPCRVMSPIFTELSKKFENLIFLEVDVDEVQVVAAEIGIKAMPTFVFIKDKEPFDKIVGANKHELERKLEFCAMTPVSSA